MGFFHILKSVALVSIVTSALNLGVSFIFSFIMSKEDYGVYTYWLSLYFIFLNLIPFGVIGALTVNRLKLNEAEYGDLLLISLLVVMPMVLLFTLLFIYIKSTLFENDLNIEYFAPISAYFYAICLILLSILRIDQDFKPYSIIFIMVVSFSSLIQVTSYLFFQNIQYVIYSFSIAMFISAMCCLLILSKFFIFNFSSFNFKMLKSILPGQFKYGTPLVLGSVGMSFMVVGDKIIVKNLVDEYTVGLYATTALVCSTVLFLVNNFAAAWGGFLIKKLSVENTISSYIFFKKSQKILFLSLLPMSFIIIGIQYLFYTTLYSVEDLIYVLVLVNLSLGYCIYGASKFFVGYMMFFKYNTDILKGTVIGLVGLIISSYYLQFDAVINISLGVLIGFICQLTYFVYFVNKKIYGERNVL